MKTVEEICCLIEKLKTILPEPVDYAELVGAPLWAYGCRYVYQDPSNYFIEEAIQVLEEYVKEQSSVEERNYLYEDA